MFSVGVSERVEGYAREPGTGIEKKLRGASRDRQEDSS